MFPNKQLLLFYIPFDSFDSLQRHLFFVYPKKVNLESHFVCALAVPNQHNLGLKVHQLYFYTSSIKKNPACRCVCNSALFSNGTERCRDNYLQKAAGNRVRVLWHWKQRVKWTKQKEITLLHTLCRLASEED